MASFRDLFPPGDEEARWVLVLCLARNDIVATAERIVAANEDDDGTNVHWARILAAHLFEAAKFLRQGSSVKASANLIDQLPAKRQEDYEALCDAEFLKKALAHDRNLTFHYPTVDCGDARHGGPQLVLAMDETSGDPIELLVEYDDVGEPKGYRYRFADSVAVEFAVGKFGRSADEQRAAIKRIQDLAFAFARFADTVFYEWAEMHDVSFEDASGRSQE